MKIGIFCTMLLIVSVVEHLAQNPSTGTSGIDKTAADRAFSLSKVAQVTVRVKDLSRAIAFYTEKLGLKLMFQAPSVAGIDCGGTHLLLNKPGNAAEDHPSSIIYFDAPDIQYTHKMLTDRGITFVEKPNKIGEYEKYSVWIAVFRDSEDNLMGLRSLVPIK